MAAPEQKAKYEVKKTLIKGDPNPMKKANGKTDTMLNIVGYLIGKVGAKEAKAFTTEEAAHIAAKYGLANAEPKVRKRANGEGITCYISSTAKDAAGKTISFKSDSFLVRIDDENGVIKKDFAEKFKDTVKQKTSKGKSKADIEATRKKILEATANIKIDL